MSIPRALKRVVILANSTKQDISRICEQFSHFFTGRGIECSILMLSSSVEDLKREVPDCDLAVSLGGDGTVLTAVSILRGKSIPILAVNRGTFGYIAETPIAEMERVFNEYVSGRTSTYSRMMVDVEVRREGKVVFSSSALNDVAVSAVLKAKTAKLDLIVNGILAANLKGDGILIATPTGSTAYSLAAGGPILDDSIDAIIINPICPFTMSVRPLVVNKDSVVTLRIPHQKTDLSITCDGHESFAVQEGDEITVMEGSCRAIFVENSDRKFIEVLRSKLGWAGGFNA